MITWPWEWKKRAIAAEAELGRVKEIALDGLEAFKNERDAAVREADELRKQVRRMSER